MKSIVSQILFSYSKTNAPLLWYFFADRMEFSILKVNSLTLLYCINHDEKAFSNVSINFFVAEMIVHSTTAAYRQRNLKAVWCSSWIKKEYFKVFANVVFFYKYSPLITLHVNCNSFIFHWVLSVSDKRLIDVFRIFGWGFDHAWCIESCSCKSFATFSISQL